MLCESLILTMVDKNLLTRDEAVDLVESVRETVETMTPEDVGHVQSQSTERRLGDILASLQALPPPD